MAEEHHPLVADELMEINGSVGCLRFEVGRDASQPQAVEGVGD